MELNRIYFDIPKKKAVDTLRNFRIKHQLHNLFEAAKNYKMIVSQLALYAILMDSLLYHYSPMDPFHIHT